jgi:hypothetical protein
MMTEDLKRNPNIWIHQDGLQEDLNRSHNVTLTEAQISTILYVMEGYLQGDDSLDDEFMKDCDNIFAELEGVVDNYYDVRSCITNGEDYADCVDKLVESMEDG